MRGREWPLIHEPVVQSGVPTAYPPHPVPVPRSNGSSIGAVVGILGIGYRNGD